MNNQPVIEGETVHVGSDVRFGRNVVIGDQVRIGDRCIIGDNVRLDHCRLGDGVRVERNAYVGYSTLTGWFSMPSSTKLDEIGPCMVGSGSLIRTDAVIYKGVEIGENCWINHGTLIRERSIIGHHTSIGSMADLEGYLSIGHHCSLHSQVHIGAKTTIGDYVFMAPFCVTTNDNPMGYMRNFDDRNEQGPTIGFGTCVAVHVTILPRVRVGMETIIGANSVVTKDVPDGKVALGVPARIVGDVPENLHLAADIRRQYGRLP